MKYSISYLLFFNRHRPSYTISAQGVRLHVQLKNNLTFSFFYKRIDFCLILFILFMCRRGPSCTVSAPVVRFRARYRVCAHCVVQACGTVDTCPSSSVWGITLKEWMMLVLMVVSWITPLMNRNTTKLEKSLFLMKKCGVE